MYSDAPSFTFAVTLQPDQRLLCIHLHGTVTGTCVLETLQAMWEDPRYDPSFKQLWDCRAVTALDIDWPEFKAIGEALQARCIAAPTDRAAIVAPRENNYYGALALTRYARKSARQKRVFRQMEAALQWLDDDEASAPVST